MFFHANILLNSSNIGIGISISHTCILISSHSYSTLLFRRVLLAMLYHTALTLRTFVIDYPKSVHTSPSNPTGFVSDQTVPRVSGQRGLNHRMAKALDLPINLIQSLGLNENRFCSCPQVGKRLHCVYLPHHQKKNVRISWDNAELNTMIPLNCQKPHWRPCLSLFLPQIVWGDFSAN